MAFDFGGRTIQKVGVIGSGQIGPDIALHFTKVFAPHGVPVIVVDVSEDALANGISKTESKIQKGVKAGAFNPEEADAMLENITFTSDYEAVAGADFVIEAATEEKKIKSLIVSQLEKLCSEDAILVSNSSHMEPEEIFSDATHKKRTAVVHYFFPAERNPIVEVVPGAETSQEVHQFLLGFYEAIGKVPVSIKSRYGYAIDPLFEGLLLTSVLLVEEGVATPKEIDVVAQKILGLGVGPFTAHNLTGGNPITAHGLREMTSKIGPWFRTPSLLEKMVQSSKDWEVPSRGEVVEISEENEALIGDALRATFWGLCCEVIDAKLCSISDLEMAVEMALVIRPPFSSMNKFGVSESLKLVEAFKSRHPDFPVAKCLQVQSSSGSPWKISHVMREDRDGIAVLTIRRPRVLNALNRNVFDELQEHAESIASDDAIQGVVIKGFGTKAFVSGADVGFLAKIENGAEGEATSAHSHEALLAIENLKKPVICAMNGLAFGGGNELAMACHARICRAGIQVFIAQPEPNLGIIPGAGATQRLPRLIGIEKASEMLRTGKPISSSAAVEMGLVREEARGDLLERAINLARSAASGEITLKPIEQGPIECPDTLPQVDIGHLSQAVDQLICRAIVEGAKLSLREGLALEAKSFGEVCETKDMRIGVDNFIKNGPRSKAEFVHA